MNWLNRVGNFWAALPRSAKIVAGIGGIFYACIFFSMMGVFIPNAPEEPEIDQEAVVQTVMAEIRQEIEETEAAASSTPTITPEPSQTPTSTPLAYLDSCIGNVEFETGRVVDVIDGDTIRVEINSQEHLVRYIGIDAPDVASPNNAAIANANLVAGKIVTLFKDQSNTDPFDRLLRFVYVDETFVNHELVRLGFATSVSYPPDTSCNPAFDSAQAAAMSAGLGMWIPTATPTPFPTPIPVPTATSQPSGSSGGSGSSNCHPSYPTVCIAYPPPDLDCKDVPYKRFTVVGSDPHRFDGDNDGIGCES